MYDIKKVPKEPNVELVGKNSLEEKKTLFMVRDVPIPFGYSLLILHVDFQVMQDNRVKMVEGMLQR